MATRWRWPPERSAGRRSISVFEPEGRRDLSDPRCPLRLRDAAELEAEAEVLLDRHLRVERVVLEHHRDVAVARAQPRDVPVADHDAALGDLLEPGDHPQQRRLPAAGRPDEDHELAVTDVERDGVEGRDPVRDRSSSPPRAGSRPRQPGAPATPASGDASCPRSGRAPTRSAAISTRAGDGLDVRVDRASLRDARVDAARRSGDGCRRTPPQSTSGNGAPSWPVRAAHTRA